MRQFAVLIIIGLLACLALSACSRPPSATSFGEVAEKGKAIVAMLAKGDFAGVTKEFDPTMQKALPEQQLKDNWDSLIAQNGAFQSQQEVRTTKEQGYDVANVTAKFERGKLTIKVIFDNQQKISGLWIK